MTRCHERSECGCGNARRVPTARAFKVGMNLTEAPRP